MYAFRVDDAKNLEHLYWVPPSPALITSSISPRVTSPTPFDPAGAITKQTIDKALGLGELRDINSEAKITGESGGRNQDEGH